MSDPEEIVGHTTFRDADGYRHEPITREQADALWAAAEAEQQARAKDMPTEEDAVRAMCRAYQRLRELGWKETMYRSSERFGMQRIIEPGSSGIHEGRYDGEWPDGSWWLYDGDVWPSQPCLAKDRSDGDKHE
jgi:hypothetical protein